MKNVKFVDDAVKVMNYQKYHNSCFTRIIGTSENSKKQYLNISVCDHIKKMAINEFYAYKLLV